MLLLRSIAALAGLLVVMWLILDTGHTDVLSSLALVGWGITGVLAIELISLAMRASAWRCLATSWPTLNWSHWFVSRWIRQAVSQLLPVAQIGGELAGARLVTKFGLPVAHAVSSTIVDLTLGATAQMIFTLMGIAALLGLKSGSDSVGLLFALTIVLLALIFLFAYLQQRGLVAHILRRITRKSTKFDDLVENAEAIDRALRDIYQRRRHLVVNVTIQLLTQIATSAEVWLVCLLIGSPIGFIEAFVIQSLTRAARAAAFFVPAGVGVQEVSILWLAAAFDISPTNAIAIALVKRARELIVGLPALGAWALLESRKNKAEISPKE